MADTPRPNKSGRGFFGPKDLKYLKKVSRQAIEKHTETTVLYFELDYENSRRNFYGEMVIKKFVQSKGVPIKGVVEVLQSDTATLERIPNKLTTMTFSCYLDHLREEDVEPRIGDYFATKNRFYLIHDRTILDANEVQVAVDREALSIRYTCVEADEESILPDIFATENQGTKNEIEGNIEPQV